MYMLIDGKGVYGLEADIGAKISSKGKEIYLRNISDKRWS